MADNDIVDRLMWMDINTLDPHLGDLCTDAMNEIERLRARNASLQRQLLDLAVPLAYLDKDD